MKQLFLLFFILFISCSPKADDVRQSLRNRLDQMEAAYQNHENQVIANIYTDDAYLIGPRGIISQGRREVNEYWKNDEKNQISWTLEDYGIYLSLEELLVSEVYINMERKPPTWKQLNIPIEFKSDGKYFYQLGRSTLINQRNQDRGGSIVNFLLVWEKIGKDFFIFIDSYI